MWWSKLEIGRDPETQPKAEIEAETETKAEAAQTLSPHESWLEYTYERYPKQIRVLDGTYVELYDADSQIRRIPPSIGDCCWVSTNAEILQILGPYELLVKDGEAPHIVSRVYGFRHNRYRKEYETADTRFVFHVKGIDTSNMVTGIPFGGGDHRARRGREPELVYVGTYGYVTAAGSSNTVQSYVPRIRPDK
ncbi:MAG: hypothetical protein ABIF82_06225 [Planctomycetota bacterium]